MRPNTSEAGINAISLHYAVLQHGVVARQQLIKAGVSNSTIAKQLDRHLFKVFSSAYAVGRPDVTQDGLRMAGVLASGDGAALGYRSAGATAEFLDPRPIIEVVRPGRCRNEKGRIGVDGKLMPVTLIVRGTRDLSDRDRAWVRGIPVTSVERTLLDLASILSPTRLMWAFIEADRLGLLNDEDLLYCAARSRGRPGAGAFRQLVADRLPEVDRTKSILEGLFLPLCRDHDIPRPEINVAVGDHEVDCLWRKEGLIVELDSREYHRGVEIRERDMEQTNRYQVEGWTVLRFSWRMVIGRPNRVADQVLSRLRGI